MGYVYFGEAAGARILRYGIGVSQIGDAYQLDVKTWEVRPAGAAGKAVFRNVDVLVRHRQGYSITVTPVVDGVDQPSQSFSSPPPSGGATEETHTLKAYVGKSGLTLAVRVRTSSLSGETEIVDVGWSGAVLRAAP